MSGVRLRFPDIVIVALMLLGLTLITPDLSEGEPDYRGMVDEIGVFFEEALESYKAGNAQEAKSKAQSAYFEVFENLEGPIRINISAKKNFELEEEFIAIRKMFVNGEPVEVIERQINDFIAELRTIPAQLEGGFELVAESIEDAEPMEPEKKIEPVWLKALEIIQSKLEESLEAYKAGDDDKAEKLAVQAQYNGYKNTLLETAVRRYVSHGKDYENNSKFSEIIGMIRNGKAPEEIEAGISGLTGGLEDDLPGLPFIEGALSKRAAKKAEKARNNIPDKDWAKVTANLFGEIEKALAFYEQGLKKEAVGLVQDTYFDVFEASGMERKIGYMDAGFMAKLEGHFSMIVGQMKKGVSVENIRNTLTAMNADFDKALNMLGKGADTPMALFFYSLMIILREGFEAILIITAILTYLTKTGNGDKARVIYSGCIWALMLSLVTAILVKWVFHASAASQEIMEGGTMLLAAAVLFFVSYWLISKAEAQKWMAFIKGKVRGSLSSGSLKALWFTAFLAVYREGAETVLFYQALGSNADALGMTSILGGFLLGCVLLVVVYMVMKFGAVKIPIRQFFIFTGVLLYYMAFVFAGKGMMEFIEGKLFEPSLVSWAPNIPFLGVYPYWQTLIPQLFLVLAALAGFVVMKKFSDRKPVVQESAFRSESGVE